MPAPDITKDYIRRLTVNGAEAEKHRTSNAPLVAPGLWVAASGARWVWFYNQVRNGGPWDLKNTAYKAYRTSGIALCARQYRVDKTGNFHYGFCGAAAGFLDYALFKAAGEAQQRAGTSRPSFSCTYGDDPEDHEFIRLGILLYETYALAVDDVNLGSILSKFQTIVCRPVP